ncbi:MAG TPA: glycosyltransferase [Terriglobia bacterium]|nr:glycosyltransferase [Terriglobia bacterium]
MRPLARILHIRPSSFVGGPERQLMHYAQLDESASTETILGTFVGEREGRAFVAAVEERGGMSLSLPAGSLGDCAAFPGLLRYLREQKIALVCTHGYQADLMGILAGRIRHLPVACFIRGWTWEDWKVRVYEAADRSFLPLASRVVCLSEVQANQLGRRRRLRHKLRVVLNVVENRNVSPKQRLEARQEIRRRFGIAQESSVVAIAGRLSPEKGAEYLIQAVPHISKDFPDARFVIFGDGRLRTQLEEIAKTIGAAGRIIFARHVPEFTALLPGVDVLANPSLTEVMPNVVLEAMAAGVPVVATSVGGVAEIAGESGALALVPPADALSLASAIAQLLADPVRAVALGIAGQKRVRQAFSPERQSAQLLALYQELIPSLRSEQLAPGLASEADAFHRADV